MTAAQQIDRLQAWIETHGYATRRTTDGAIEIGFPVTDDANAVVTEWVKVRTTREARDAMGY